MLNDKLSAKLADNLCFLGDFATTMDYATDGEGSLCFEYNVELGQVGKAIVDNERFEAMHG